jgi:hypothetical protein
LRLPLLVGGAFFAACASAQLPSDWEREHAERLKQSQELVVTPPHLDRSRLVELDLEADSDFRYFIDAGSVSVGSDRIVRYAMLARSAGGTENVTFEGLRCPGDYRVYAVGRSDGSWGGRPGAWRPVPSGRGMGQNALSRRYFCPGRAAIQNAAEGVHALRARGHPGAFSKEH